MTARMLRLIALASTIAAGAQEPAGVIGQWLTDDRSAIVAIDRCGMRVCGVIVKILDSSAPANDINNPVADMRRHPLVGVRVLSGLDMRDGAGRDGSAYDPKTGRSYRAGIRLVGRDTLKVTGCVIFLCRSRNWTRVR